MFRVLLLVVSVLLLNANSKEDETSDINITFNTRLGASSVKNEQNHSDSKIDFGGYFGATIEMSKWLDVSSTIYVTKRLFEEYNNDKSHISEKKSYALLGEAYAKFMLQKTELTVGRQRLETPYMDSNDVGMIPNRFMGYLLENRYFPYIFLRLGSFGMFFTEEGGTTDKFVDIQKEAILFGGVLYSGLKNTKIEAWRYRLDSVDFDYFAIAIDDIKDFDIAGQYSNQDNGNSIFGLSVKYNMDVLIFTLAYNEVSGIVSNGFGGGSFLLLE
jgi:hypothetical protein